MISNKNKIYRVTNKTTFIDLYRLGYGEGIQDGTGTIYLVANSKPGCILIVERLTSEEFQTYFIKDESQIVQKERLILILPEEDNSIDTKRLFNSKTKKCLNDCFEELKDSLEATA